MMSTLREHLGQVRKLIDAMPPDMLDVRSVRPILEFVTLAATALEKSSREIWREFPNGMPGTDSLLLRIRKSTDLVLDELDKEIE